MHHEGWGNRICSHRNIYYWYYYFKRQCQSVPGIGCCIRGSGDTNDYKVDGAIRGVVFADDATNISITGHGEIDGCGISFFNVDKAHNAHDYESRYTRQGDKFMDGSDGFPDGPVSYPYRPGMMVVLLRCSNVNISDVFFHDSPSWTIRIGDCENVCVKGITILNDPRIPNNDGIHCTHSRNIRISDCHIEAGDDGIIVSGFPYGIDEDGDQTKRVSQSSYGNQTRWAENVTVTNCTMSSRSAGIRIGYGDYSIRNCVFQNLVIYNSNRGVGIFSRDTGTIEHILFDNIIIQTRIFSGDWWGKGEPIHISAISQDSTKKAGKISDINFSNITADAETGIIFWSDADSLMEDIRLNNVSLRIKNSSIADTYGGNIDLRPAARKKDKVFQHDIPGIYCYNFKNLVIKNTQVSWKDSMAGYFTHALQLENINGADIENFSGESAKGNLPVKGIDLKNTRNVRIR
jgi:polygalacturonase